jgi:hypothetical protein
VAGNEPPIDGTGSMTGGGGFRRPGIGRAITGRLAAKVTADGVRKLTTEFTGLLGVLQKVRGEMAAINKLASGMGGIGGIGQGTPTGAAGTQPVAPTGGGGGGFGIPGAALRGPGGFNYGGAAIATAAALGTGLNVINDRFARNVAQSAPISSRDLMTASMYGPEQYRRLEGARYGGGAGTLQYIGSRENAQATQQIALGFGTSLAGSNQFMSTAGAMVQASGGTINAAQAASQVGLFAAPTVSRRAQALGITMFREGGALQNPMKVALDYVKDYEKRNNVTMNEMDFSALRSPGSPHRARMKQMYGLSDEAIDMVVQAGMQNMQFRSVGGGRNINFDSGADLSKIGMNTNALGLSATRFGTTSQRREARFFNTQEGAMTDRLGMENAIQEALSDTEEALGGVIGMLHEFERVGKLALTVLGGIGALSMVLGGPGGGLGGGGGLLSMLGGRGGAGGGGPGGIPGQMTLPGMGPQQGSLLSRMAGSGAARMGAGVVGTGMLMGGAQMAMNNTSGAGIAGSAAMAGGGAAATLFAVGGTAALTGPAAPFVIGGAALVAGGIAAKNYFEAKSRKNVQKGYDEGVGMTDSQLFAGMGDYIKNEAPGGRHRGQGAGDKQRGRFDAFARRRGALLAAALVEAQQSGDLKLMSSTESAEVADLVNFFGSDDVFKDDKLFSNKTKVGPYVSRIRGTAAWQKYFGPVADPFAYIPVNTSEATSLVMTPEEYFATSTGTAQTGDPVFALDGGAAGSLGAYRKMPRDPFPGGGDPVTGKGGSGATWDRLDSRMKERLTRLLTAAGGRVWLGNGWRSEAQQREMFLSRYVKDPNGEIKNFEGSNWRRVRGIPAAPPGRSMHEIGMAADLEGDLNWVVAHAHEFGLKHFANVNNEPHHVQPAEFPNSRSQFEKGGGTSDSSGADTGGAAAPTTPTTNSVGGGGATSFSGIGFSIAAAAQGTTAGGGFAGGGGAAAAASGGGGGPVGAGADSGVWAKGSDNLARGIEVVKLLKQAGFSGDELTRMAAIAWHESNWYPWQWVTDDDDIGGGLFAINQKPWLDKGMTPLYSKAEIQDPLRSAQIAWEYYRTRGYQPWTTRNKSLDMGAQARAAANVGDAVFDTGTMPMPSVGGGGNANVSINVSITSTGNVRYDAEALGEAVRPVLTNVMAEISTKRGS